MFCTRSLVTYLQTGTALSALESASHKTVKVVDCTKGLPAIRRRQEGMVRQKLLKTCLSALPYVASEMVMSYAEIDFAMVPAAAPTLKNHLATSCPAPISASTPYHFGFRFTSRACQNRAHVLVADVGMLGLLALAHVPSSSTQRQSTIDTLAAVLENVDSICRCTTTAEFIPGQYVEHLDVHVASNHT